MKKNFLYIAPAITTWLTILGVAFISFIDGNWIIPLPIFATLTVGAAILTAILYISLKKGSG